MKALRPPWKSILEVWNETVLIREGAKRRKSQILSLERQIAILRMKSLEPSIQLIFLVNVQVTVKIIAIYDLKET